MRNQEKGINQEIQQMKQERTRRQAKRLRQQPDKALNKPTLLNHAQEVHFDTSYNLYENINKRVTVIPQELIYDTGAGLTMISGQYDGHGPIYTNVYMPWVVVSWASPTQTYK
jgi:hypothetical protein